MTRDPLADRPMVDETAKVVEGSGQPCVMGYLVECPHMELKRVLLNSHLHECQHFPRCPRYVLVPKEPQ